MVEGILDELSKSPEGRAFAPRLLWGCGLLTSKDFNWLADYLEGEVNYERQVVLAQWLRGCWNPQDPSQTDRVVRLAQSIRAAGEVFSIDLRPIPLDSERARMERETLRMSARLQRHDPLNPPPVKRVMAALEQFESGNTDAFWLLIREMSLTPASRHYEAGGEVSADLTEYPGWKEADLTVRARIIQAAEKYVREKDANADAWFTTPNVVHLPAAAGFKALYLLYKESGPLFSALPANVWSKWVPIILDYPQFDHREVHSFLAKKAYEIVPDDTLLWLTRILEKEKQSPTGILVLAKMEGLWNIQIAGVVLQTARALDTSPRSLDRLLNSLLEHGDTEGISLARSLLDLRLSVDEANREKALSAAFGLLEHSRGSWSTLWPLIVDDSRFGHALMVRISNAWYHTATPFLNRLTEEQIAELVRWLYEQYPHENDFETRQRAYRSIGGNGFAVAQRVDSLPHGARFANGLFRPPIHPESSAQTEPRTGFGACQGEHAQEKLECCFAARVVCLR